MDCRTQEQMQRLLQGTRWDNDSLDQGGIEVETERKMRGTDSRKTEEIKITMAWRLLQYGKPTTRGHMAEELRENLGQEKAELTNLGGEKNRMRPSVWFWWTVIPFSEVGKEKKKKVYKEGDGLFWPYQIWVVWGSKIYWSKLQGSVYIRDLYLSHQHTLSMLLKKKLQNEKKPKGIYRPRMKKSLLKEKQN